MKTEKELAQYDKMVNTPIPKLVMMLGIPTMLSMLVTNIYNMADTFFVGQLGTSASGAVGIVFGLMAILQAFGFMFGHGSGSIVSRRLGSGAREEASVYASTGFVLAFSSGLIIGVLGLIFLNPMLRLLGCTETILPYARDYAIYILGAAPFMTGSFALNNILRYEGLAAKAMVGLMAGSILNIFGDMVFIFGFDMGTGGAGLSTAVSQIIGFFLLLSVFLRGKSQTVIAPRNIRLSAEVVKSIVATGFPSLVRQGLSSVSTMLLNRMAKPFGDAAIAAMGIVGRVNFFVFAVALGIGQGFQPVGSFNYGAKKYSRVKKAFWFTVVVSEILLTLAGIAVFFGAQEIVDIFRDDPEVVRIGVPALRWQCMALLFQPIAVCSNMMFQSCGRNVIATLTATLRSGLYFIPIILVFTHLFGLAGIQAAQPVTDILLFFTTIPFLTAFMRSLPCDGEDIYT